MLQLSAHCVPRQGLHVTPAAWPSSAERAASATLQIFSQLPATGLILTIHTQQLQAVANCAAMPARAAC